MSIIPVTGEIKRADCNSKLAPAKKKKKKKLARP
jgi:hypothetical protein